MKLYQELKRLTRINYSTISKHLDGEFKNKSIEGYVKLKERLYERKHYKPPYVNTKVQEMLDKMITIQRKKNESQITEIVEKKPFDLDTEISDIFRHKPTKVNRPKPISLERIHTIKPKIVTDKTYYPNYNAIQPHMPICSFRALPTKVNKKIMLRKLLFESKPICRKLHQYQESSSNRDYDTISTSCSVHENKVNSVYSRNSKILRKNKEIKKANHSSLTNNHSLFTYKTNSTSNYSFSQTPQITNN